MASKSMSVQTVTTTSASSLSNRKKWSRLHHRRLLNQPASNVHAIRDSAFSKARLAMARNIHDSVLQNLAGLGMRFGAMKLDLKAGRIEETMSELDKLFMRGR